MKRLLAVLLVASLLLNWFGYHMYYYAVDKGEEHCRKVVELYR